MAEVGTGGRSEKTKTSMGDTYEEGLTYEVGAWPATISCEQPRAKSWWPLVD